MADDSAGEKTEEPTGKRLSDARDEGNVAKSQELPSVAVLLSALVALTIFGPFMLSQLQSIMKGTFSAFPMGDPDIQQFMALAQKTVWMLFVTVIPVFVAVSVTAIFSNVVQVGFMISTKSIKPKLEKLNVIKGLGKLFSKDKVMELFKSLAKLAIIGAVAYYTIRSEWKNFPSLGEMQINAIFSYLFLTIFKLFVRCILAMIVLVVIDYVFQQWNFKKKMKMTKQEVKDENKMTQGDPLVKSRIKTVQMEMARKRMMQAVPEADVVITNPTFIATALKYDKTKMGAPKLIAKGAGEIAKKIRALAKEHDIPIVENKALARSLYSLVEVGKEIIPDLYQAVAEVLAYIYKLKGDKAYAQ